MIDSNKATRLIELSDGINIEATVTVDEVEAVAGGTMAIKQVDATLDEIQPLLIKLCTPFVNTFHELNRDMTVEQAEVEVGLSMKGEGNLYVTKASAEANFKLKLILKPASLLTKDQNNEKQST